MSEVTVYRVVKEVVTMLSGKDDFVFMHRLKNLQPVRYAEEATYTVTKEPVMEWVVEETDRRGTINRRKEFFCISTDLRQILGWDTDYKTMQAQTNLALQEVKAHKVVAEALKERLEEYNSKSLWKKLVFALKGETV